MLRYSIPFDIFCHLYNIFHDKKYPIVFPLRAVQFPRLNSKRTQSLKNCFQLFHRFFSFKLHIHIYIYTYSWLRFSLKWIRIFTRSKNLIVPILLSTLYIYPSPGILNLKILRFTKIQCKNLYLFDSIQVYWNEWVSDNSFDITIHIYMWYG